LKGLFKVDEQLCFGEGDRKYKNKVDIKLITDKARKLVLRFTPG